MLGIVKTVFRVGLITAACAGTAAFLAGEDRVEAIVGQAQSTIRSAIDDHIDDPVALRNQLRELEREYPDKIGQVRADLAELNEQIRQLEREQAVSERVVGLADEDLVAMRGLIGEAEQAQVEKTAYLGSGGAVQNVVSIRFDSRLLTLDQAHQKAQQIGQTRVAYANRAADASHDLVYLRQQSERLSELLGQLETEQSQFQGQLWQLDRQVDAIARNEKLIDMLEKRRKSIEAMSRYECVSLDQMVGKLNEVRARQQAELETLTGTQSRTDYEDIAKMQLETGMPSSADVSGAEGLVYRSGAEARVR